MYKIILVIAMAAAGAGLAAVQPAGIFTSYAVLQQNEPVRIWGVAAPGEKVSVEFSGQTKNEVADEHGKWMVTLDPIKACSEGRTMIFRGSLSDRPVELSNIVVGEVWFAGGQSNMQTTMGYYKKTTQDDINSANDPLLRMVTIPERYYEGQNNKIPQWRDSNPVKVAEFSASAYYFAKNLRAQLNVPVGIISCSVGGTPAEAWMDREVMASNPDIKPTLDAYDRQYKKAFSNETAYLEYVKGYDREVSEWYRRRAAGEPPGPRPSQKMGPRNLKRPGGLYENMFLQTVPYTLRGVIWYQGEENASAQAGFQYRVVFSELIQNWREQFRNKKLPFFFVQLATVGTGDDKTAYWPEMRESQKWVEENVKHTGMAVLVDGGERDSVHPHSKDKVGYRLSLLARNLVYGETNLVCRGPRLLSAVAQTYSIVLTFDSTPMLQSGGDDGFEICGKDGRYVSAGAQLVDGKIVVSSEFVQEPLFIRYGWRKWFDPILFNTEGLPSSPFRTDSFPEVSKGRYYLDKSD